VEYKFEYGLCGITGEFVERGRDIDLACFGIDMAMVEAMGRKWRVFVVIAGAKASW
jgi:hypothetical protein